MKKPLPAAYAQRDADFISMADLCEQIHECYEISSTELVALVLRHIGENWQHLYWKHPIDGIVPIDRRSWSLMDQLLAGQLPAIRASLIDDLQIAQEQESFFTKNGFKISYIKPLLTQEGFELENLPTPANCPTPADETKLLKEQLEQKNKEVEQLQQEIKQLKSMFDSASPIYPPELDIAVKAWQVVSLQVGGTKTPKKQINDWLIDNQPHFGPGARERISVVANWKKHGGPIKLPE